MKFIVKPIKTEEKEKRGGPPHHTLCAKCSEDPRFCGDDI